MPSGREYKGLVDKGLRYNSVLENERGVEGDQDCCQREKTQTVFNDIKLKWASDRD